jgi:hypothetical protein
MIKRVILLLLLTSSFFILNTFADESITIDIWSDRTVNLWDTVNINATIWWDCSNFAISTIYFMEQNPRWDWATLQSWGTWNLLYSFTATGSKQIKAQIRCPQWSWPIYVSEIIWEDIINITVNSPTPIVNAWTNTSFSSWDLVSLSWNITWTDSSCTVFDYLWEQISWPTVEITNSWTTSVNSNTYSLASFTFPYTTESIWLKLNVTPQSCANAGNTYSWTVTYSKRSSWWGWWRSHYSRMLDEANSLFFDTWTIDNINLELNINKEKYSPYLDFTWNNIGWDWHILYILEYSTWSEFIWSKQFDTNEKFYNLEETLIDINSYIHYFRLKACYQWKCSNYSPVLKYYREDYIKITCNKCNKLQNFDDVLSWVDYLLEDYFKITCKECWKNKKQVNLIEWPDYLNVNCSKCNKLPSFWDILEWNNSLLNNYFQVQCVNCKK